MARFCKQRLSWEVAQRKEASDGRQLGRGKGHTRQLLPCAKQAVSINSSTTYFIWLLMPHGGLLGVLEGRDWLLQWDQAAKSLPVVIFVPLAGCRSSAMDQAKRSM